MKQYEPYFSSLFEYETEAELVQTGVTPVITYDGLGRVLRTDFPDGSYSRVERPSAWLERAFDRNDTVGESGNLWAAKRDPLITPSASAEDQRALTITLPHGNTATQTHSDVMGRPFLVVAHNKIGAADQFLETRTKLDIEGQVLEVKDPLIRTCQTNAYSMAGMLLKDTNIDKGARWYLGDVNGAPLRRWDDRLQVFRSTYDVLRRPTHLHMKPGAGTELLLERMVYGDSAGTGIPDPKVGNLRGKMIRHFDGAGRIKAESYDFKGNSLTSDRVLAQSYTTTVDWTSLNALTSIGGIDTAAAALLETEPPFVETRAFDALNRITKLVTPDNSEYLPVYNEASLLNAVNVKVRGVSPAKNFVANIDYDAKGQRTKIQYSDLGSGARFTTDYTYDKLTFRLTKLKTTRSSPGNTLQELSYTFDPSGNIVQISDAAQQSLFYDDAFVAPDQKFVYDAIYRLVEGSGREHRSVGDVMVDHRDQAIWNLPLPSDPTAVRNYTETYAYDEVGNILEMFHDAVANTWTRSYIYLPANNRLTETSGGMSFRYDEHGSATEMPHLPAVTYSPFDQMASAVKPGAGTVYFVYDSSGQRVRKVWEETGAIKHERIYLGAYEIFRKRVSGTVNLERQTLHVNDGAQRIAMVETKTIDTAAPGSTGVEMRRFQLGNNLGSTMLEVDETGLIISHEEYTPYGVSAYRAARSTVDVSARRYRYAGKERDEETGLYYNGARYLAAWLGRWTSADPIGIGADGPGLYNYTRGSPVNHTDPSGTDALGQGIADALEWASNEVDRINYEAGAQSLPLVDQALAGVELNFNEPGQAGFGTDAFSPGDLREFVGIEVAKLERDYGASDEQGHPLWEKDSEGEWDFVGDDGRYLKLPVGTSDVEMYLATAGVGEVVGAVGRRLGPVLSRGFYAEGAATKVAGGGVGKIVTRGGHDARVGTVISPPRPGQIVPGEKDAVTKVVSAEGHGWEFVNDSFIMPSGKGVNLPMTIDIDDAAAQAIAAERAILPPDFIYFGPGKRTPQHILTPGGDLGMTGNQIKVNAPTLLSDIIAAQEPGTIVTWAACRLPTCSPRIKP